MGAHERYRSIEYGLKKLLKTEQRLQKRADRLVADVLPDKSQESSAVFGEIAIERMPFDINDWYTDRGTEWKGTADHAFVAFCREHGMTQHFTKPRTPQTNGKAERVIRTLMEEWHRKHRFTSREERRILLYAYVDRFNHERVHGTLGMMPIEKLGRCAAGERSRRACPAGG